ncbi:hypothetical protein LRD69_29675 [Streptomyces sp. JH14]|uniref:hypothetical protein n=1 Tax=Streptomyces sp. JH14 TaxID=2793630 RepID=UPI0023F99C77|nr:hypothetical protein [Streptomyces sp. JH14]MDF6046222.1 hypothetical protein [Streptomyces sp. JH14]
MTCFSLGALAPIETRRDGTRCFVTLRRAGPRARSCLRQVLALDEAADSGDLASAQKVLDSLPCE